VVLPHRNGTPKLKAFSDVAVCHAALNAISDQIRFDDNKKPNDLRQTKKFDGNQSPLLNELEGWEQEFIVSLYLF
jgi:hypothetical protein